MFGFLRRRRIRGLVNGAFFAAERGSYDEAINLLEQALEIDPHNAHANNEMGFCLIRMGKPEQAMPFARTAVACEPHNPKFRNGLIAVQFEVIQRLRTKKAVREAATVALGDIQELIEQHPDYPPAYLARAQTLALSGAPREQWEAALARSAEAYERSSRMASGLRATASRMEEVISQNVHVCMALAEHWAKLEQADAR